VRPVCLVVAAGPDKGRRLPLPAEPVTVGRGAGQSLQLSDAAVSRHHLTLRQGSDGNGQPTCLVHEIKGVNPVWTLEGGQRVVLTMGYALPIGASITLGNTTLQFEWDRTDDRTAPGRGTVDMDARVSEGIAAPSRIASLAALGDRLARCGSLQAVYREATSWAVQALPASRALLLSPDGTDVLSASSDGVVGDLAVSRALLDRVRKETRAFWVRDVLAEPDLADRRSVQVRGIVGAMAAPTSGLVFYVEWGARESAVGRHDEEALLLLVCASHLVSALGSSAAERSQLEKAAKVRRGTGVDIPRMIGMSASLQKLQVFIERVAPTPATVLLRGESGTGKELAAAMLHAFSDVANGPFVAINCAAIPEQLLESELFGHEKGAFTGAVAQHEGVFERADGGTLFLDEIGEMSLSTQARMLRVLETRAFTRVGGTGEIKVVVRLIAATHRDLAAMVTDGRFRQDLLYRLSVIHTELPPLRERIEDIEPLVRHFARMLGEQIGRRIESIAPDALAALQRYRWPGNIRELRNVVERALVLGDGPEMELDDLPPEMLHAAPPASAPTMTVGTIRTLAELERDAIAAALHVTEGNKARAAALLGIDRTTLYRKLKDLGTG
jgi:DNA-binding NtrC family response regulator